MVRCAYLLFPLVMIDQFRRGAGQESHGDLLNIKTFAAGAAALALCVSLTGCGGSENFAAAAGQQEAKPPADGGSYGTIEELREAAEKAGLECPGWDLHNKATYAASSASCSDSIGLATYTSDSQLDKQLEAWKMIGEMIVLERLVGENWTIDTSDPEALQKKMGGTVFRTPGKE